MCSGAIIPMLMTVAAFSRNEANITSQKASMRQQAQNFEYQAQRKEGEIKNNEYDKQKAVRDVERQRAQAQGKSRLLSASSGVDVSSGSALDVLLDTEERGAADIFSIQEQSRRNQERLRSEANNLRTDARNALSQAKDRRSPLEKGLGQYEFASSLLSGW